MEHVIMYKDNPLFAKHVPLMNKVSKLYCQINTCIEFLEKGIEYIKSDLENDVASTQESLDSIPEVTLLYGPATRK
jgi:hypothetical protein